MMPTDFVAIVPPAWTALIRSFLVRATEFQPKQPLVAYFLKTHVAFVCLKNRTSGGKEGTSFIMTLLKELEQDKAALGSELEKNDGRTILTRMALMLFNKADDNERSGIANDTVVKMFYTSSILFEATGQYMDSGKLDPIAEEKSKYAKYVATRMNKALTSGKPYQSHNPVDEHFAAEAEPFSPPTPTPTPAPFSQPSSSSSTSASNPQQPPQAPPTQHQVTPPLFPPAEAAPAFGYGPPPPPTPPPHNPQHQVLPNTPPSQPQHFAQPAAGAPSLDAMIDAQKFCKNAVAALQFYDHANARKQLEAALRLLQS
jgi:vacuolar protein sorting-associated protein VTA1